MSSHDQRSPYDWQISYERTSLTESSAARCADIVRRSSDARTILFVLTSCVAEYIVVFLSVDLTRIATLDLKADVQSNSLQEPVLSAACRPVTSPNRVVHP